MSPSSRVAGALPGLAQFHGYRRGWVRGDLLAGVTVAAYLVPQVMAYAQIAGLKPVAGLWAALGPPALYAVFGSSRLVSVGPESTTALLTAGALAPVAAGEPARYAALAALLAVLVGVLCLAGSYVRAGVLADLLSKPVLVGYLAGIGVTMIVSQLGTFTGVPVHGDGIAAELRSWAGQLSALHWPTLVLSTSVLCLLLAIARWLPAWPGPLLGLAGATVAVAVFGLDAHGIQVIGAVPAGLPVPQWPPVHAGEVPGLILPALGVALVGFSDVMLTGRAFAAREGQTVDADRELRALGVANLSAGFLQGFPVSASGSRTVIASAAGGRTQVYSLVTLAAVLLVLFAAGPVLALLPMGALAAIVVYAAVRLVNLREFRRLAAFRRSELLLALATTAGVLGLGVLYGVLVAVALSILDLLRRVARPHAAVLGYAPGVPGMHDIEDYPDAERVPGLVVYRYDAPLCFANAEDFRHRALRAVTPGTEWFVLNVEAAIEVDLTGLDALEAVRQELTGRGITLALARVKRELLDQLAADGLADRIGLDRCYPTLPAAVSAYVHEYQAEHGRMPEGVRAPVLPPNPMAS